MKMLISREQTTPTQLIKVYKEIGGKNVLLRK